MNTFLKIFNFFLLVSLLSFSACGEVEDPDNVIVDPQGMTVSLTWTNDAANPALATDLDLYIRKDFRTLVQSSKFGSFEELSVTPGILNDDTYGIEIGVDEITKITNYTLTFTGKSTGKVYKRNFGPINANDRYSTLKPFSLTVTGTKFNIF